MFELADATAERGLLKQQYFGRAPKAAVIRCCYSVSKMLQVDGGRANRIKFSTGFLRGCSDQGSQHTSEKCQQLVGEWP